MTHASLKRQAKMYCSLICCEKKHYNMADKLKQTYPQQSWINLVTEEARALFKLFMFCLVSSS